MVQVSDGDSGQMRLLSCAVQGGMRMCRDVLREEEGEGMTIEEGIIHAEDVARMNHEAAKHLTDEHPTQAEKCEACAEEHLQLAEWLKELKAYKETWRKLGMWLADTRLAIAPDEFLDDVDEKLVRVAQVDMIDTVLEWMDKQEVQE